jgi:purine-binding chemotaxis protein CheW
VNLRGVILPVTDLQQRLGWGATEATARHVIIVLQVAGQLQGIIVHTVDDIVTLQPEQIQPVPEAGGSTAAALLEGIATVEGNLIMVLDPARLGQPANELAQAA